MPAFVIIVGLSLVFYVFCLVELSHEDKPKRSTRVGLTTMKNPGLHLAGSASLPEALGERTLRSFRARPEDKVLRRKALRPRTRPASEPDDQDMGFVTTIRVTRDDRQAR